MTMAEIYDKLADGSDTQQDTDHRSRRLSRVPLNIKSIIPGVTNPLDPNAVTNEDEQFNPDLDIGNKAHITLPIPRRGQTVDRSKAWRISLFLPNTRFEPLRLELHDQIVIGRKGIGKAIDLDLAPLGGSFMGVSRRHVTLRPSADKLHVIDMNSTNGTFVNGVRLPAEVAYEVRHGDRLKLSRIEFQIRVDRQPDA